MQELSAYIRNYFFISDDAVAEMQDRFSAESVSRGDFYLKTGHQSDRISFISEGIFRIYRIAEEKEVTQWISMPGTFITDLAGFVFDQPARWNIQALTDAQIWSISKKNYEGLSEVIPDWKEIDRRFIAKCFITLEERVFTHLHMTSEARFRQLFSYSPELFNQVPLQYLASMMGMTPETLSRLRNKALNETS